MNIEDKKNYIYNIIYRLSIMILPLVVTPYIARILDATNVGLYAFSSTIVCYFILFSKLGLDNYGNRSIAFCREDKKKRSEVFFSIYIMQIITSLLSITIYLILCFTVFKKDSVIYFIQLMYLMSALFDISWFFYGIERFSITTIRSIISRVLIIIFVFIFVKSREDLWIYTLIMAGNFLLEQLILLPFSIKYLTKVKIGIKDITRHIIPNLKLFIPLLALSIYVWMDKLMLGIMVSGTAVVAYYTYAENIINLPKGILSALDTVMMPKISYLVSKDMHNEAIDKISNSLRINSFIACALCFGIAGISPIFVPWFLGNQYTKTISITIALSAVMIPMSITNVIQTQYLIPFSKEKVYIKAVIIGASINLILNIILIPKLGAFGAAIGTFAAELLVCSYELYSIRRIYRLRQLAEVLIPFMICGLIEFIVVYKLGRLPMKTLYLLILQISVGGFVYIAMASAYLLYISKGYKDLIIKKK